MYNFIINYKGDMSRIELKNLLALHRKRLKASIY